MSVFMHRYINIFSVIETTSTPSQQTHKGRRLPFVSFALICFAFVYFTHYNARESTQLKAKRSKREREVERNWKITQIKLIV